MLLSYAGRVIDEVVKVASATVFTVFLNALQVAAHRAIASVSTV